MPALAKKMSSPPWSRDRLLDQRLDLLLVARVAIDVGALQIRADHDRALVAEALDGRLADAGPGAGDDGDLADEAAAHSPTPIVAPPSTMIAWPVMKEDAGLARNTAAPAISCGSPIRRSGRRSGHRLQRVGIFPQRFGEIGPHQPRRDAIDPHALGPELRRQIARQLEIGRLGDVVGADHRRAGQPADRRDDDHRPLAALEHFRRGHRNQPVVGDDIIVEDLAELLVADPRHRPVIGVGRGVADQDVDPPERRVGLDRPGACSASLTKCSRRPRSRGPRHAWR